MGDYIRLMFDMVIYQSDHVYVTISRTILPVIRTTAHISSNTCRVSARLSTAVRKCRV